MFVNLLEISAVCFRCFALREYRVLEDGAGILGPKLQWPNEGTSKDH